MTGAWLWRHHDGHPPTAELRSRRRPPSEAPSQSPRISDLAEEALSPRSSELRAGAPLHRGDRSRLQGATRARGATSPRCWTPARCCCRCPAHHLLLLLLLFHLRTGASRSLPERFLQHGAQLRCTAQLRRTTYATCLAFRAGQTKLKARAARRCHRLLRALREKRPPQSKTSQGCSGSHGAVTASSQWSSSAEGDPSEM